MVEFVKLKNLYDEIKNCQKCELAKTRKNLVFGAGSENAEIMFVGEAPGEKEDLKGLPFVGQAGMFLEELLGSIAFSREGVFIGNVLKCRPPGNRDPLPWEVEACKPYLFEQIKLIQPRIICTLGNFSTKLLLGKTSSISQLRGKSYIKEGMVIFPTFHPAVALYNASKLEILRNDFKELKRILDEEVHLKEEKIKQMELF